MLSLSDGIARSLLLNYQWNKTKLVDDLMEKPNLVKEMYGISGVKKKDKKELDSPFMCLCCYMEGQPEERVEMECGHELCSECFTEYLSSAI